MRERLLLSVFSLSPRRRSGERCEELGNPGNIAQKRPQPAHGTPLPVALPVGICLPWDRWQLACQRFGVRREAKRHAALDSADVARLKSAVPSPF